MDRHHPQVVYVMGEGRSGSTLLGDLLGQAVGCFHAGELDHLWVELAARGSLIPCSCGEVVFDCPVWSEVVARLRAAGVPIATQLPRWSRDIGRLQRVRTFLSGPAVLGRDAAAHAYADLLARTYATIADVTGARVVVDTTKHPAEGLLACSHPRVEAFAVHLVRDPRAVLHSRIRLAGWRNRPAVRSRTIAYSAARWSARNWLAESICRRCAKGRCIRVRYEDLVADPAHTLRSVLHALGEPNMPPPTIRGRTVDIAPGHVLAGNLTKFRTGVVEVKEDAAWRAALTLRQRFVGTVFALPLLARYGYRLSVRQPTFAGQSS